MAIQADLKSAIDSGREDLIRTLAEHRMLPTVVDNSGSGLLDGSGTPSFRLDSEEAEASVVDRQTTTHVVDTLGLTTEADCGAVREEIQDHPAWAEAEA